MIIPDNLLRIFLQFVLNLPPIEQNYTLNFVAVLNVLVVKITMVRLLIFQTTVFVQTLILKIRR